MVVKKLSETENQEMQGTRIKVGKLQALRERFRELNSEEQKRVKGWSSHLDYRRSGRALNPC